MHLFFVTISWFFVVFFGALFFVPPSIAMAYAILVSAIMGAAGYLLMKIMTKLSQGISI
jgi:hypothetical protein